MHIDEYLDQQPAERKQVLQQIHNIIVSHDAAVSAITGPVMGKSGIIYNDRGVFKYALASVKGHITLHAMPIYASPALHHKYVALLPDAKFQKGCINFKDGAEIPMDIVSQLITDCAAVDMAAIMEKYRQGKKR